MLCSVTNNRFVHFSYQQDISSVMMVCASELASCAKMPPSIGTPGHIEDINMKDDLLTNEEIEPCVTGL